MSWTRASVHPPNQPRMTSYAALASLFVVDISTVWTMLRRDCFLRAGALNCCTAEELPSGSANRVDWQGIRIPVLDPPVPAWRQRPGSRVVSWSTVTRSSAAIATSVCAAAASASGSGASDPAGAGAEAQGGDAGAASVLEGRPDALGVGDRGTAEHQGAHHGDRADGGVRPTAGGAGAPDDGHARPAHVGDVVAQRLEQRPDGRRRHLALHRELGGGQLQPRLGVVLREPDLAGHVGHRDVGELGEQEHLALGDRQLGERVEGRADVGVELAVAVEDPGRVAALRVPPGQRPDPGHRVLEPGHLAPVVPGGHERVAHRAARGRQVAGEGEGLLEQRGTGRLVEVVELVYGLHGRSTVRGSPLRVHIPAGALAAARIDRCAGLESRTVGRCRVHGFVAGAARRAHGHRCRAPPAPAAAKPLMLLRPCPRQRPALCGSWGSVDGGRSLRSAWLPRCRVARRGWGG